MRARAVCAAALVLLASAVAFAQTVTGHVFEDRDADGVRDAGEPGIEGVQVRLYGTTHPAPGAAVDQTAVTGPDGSFSFSPGDGFYLIMPVDPAGWRPTPARSDGVPPGTPGYVEPVGIGRHSKLDQAIGHLEAGTLRYAALGDSIAVNWSSCPSIFDPPPAYGYSEMLRTRLQQVAPSASIVLDGNAVKGEHTDDLLVDDGASDRNNVFAVIADQPELITLSMIGNDLLNVDRTDPTQAQIDIAVREILDARRNLQEALSAMASEIPGADVAVNTLYDNEAQNCSTTGFHRDWVPIIGRILRDLAWGQQRRLSTSEVFAEFAHEDLLSVCTGFTGKICNGLFDGIHPNDEGYEIVLEKIWEGIGGLTLAPALPDASRFDLNPVERHAFADVDFGYLRRVRRLLPTSVQALGGATVGDPQAALDDQDGGLAATIEIDAAGEEVRVGVFPDWFDEVAVVRVTAGVRYRTSGGFGADAYRIAASLDGQFLEPASFDPTNWNFSTPIVGGGGPSEPAGENPEFPNARVLVVPNPSSYREVSATVGKNPVVGAAGEYDWPPVTHEELAATEIRVAATTHATACGAACPAVELDYAWVDLWGWERPRPAQVSGVEANRLPDGSLEVTFEPVPAAARYNLYFGTLAGVRAGSYDHGASAPAGPLCDAATQAAGGGRLAIVVPPAQQPAGDSYVLVTAHDADDVESPSGTDSDGVEIDRSRSVCR